MNRFHIETFRKPPNIKIYHYTSPDALLSIYNNHSIRFTDCQFLNDKFEYLYIQTPLAKALEEVLDELYCKEFGTMLQRYFDNTYEKEEVILKSTETKVPYIRKIYSHERLKKRYYLFCTSEFQDSLSLWNYYLKDEKFKVIILNFQQMKLTYFGER